MEHLRLALTRPGSVMILKGLVRRLLGERMLGTMEYHLRPEQRAAWGGPFNGQNGRRAIFDAVLPIIEPALILETGTFRGTTTQLLAETGLPVVTVEGSERNYGFSRARLRRYANVHLHLGDSRREARGALQARLNGLKDHPIFAYLDAHWHADLPLAEEIEIVFSHCPQAVAMIDDFKVPDDPGYGYDDYGSGKILDETYISGALATYDLTAFYPVLKSINETGARRGCVVLASEKMWGRRFSETGLLRCLQSC